MTNPSSSPEKKSSLIEIFSLQKKRPSSIEIKIKLLPLGREKAEKKALQGVAKEISFPGFRKGKVPEEIIRKNYASAISQELRNSVGQIAWKEIVSLSLAPLPFSENSPLQYHVDALSDKEASLSFTYEIAPEVPSPDPKAFIRSELSFSSVGEEKIEEALYQMRFFFARWEEVKEHPIQEGDYVLLNVDNLEVDPPERIYASTRFEVSDKRMAQWMKKLLLGKSVGETLEGISEPDANLPEEEKKQFSPKKVRIFIEKIEKPELPPLDDEWAKKLGSSSLEELKKSIKERLEKQASEDALYKKRKQVEEFLLVTYPFDLPPSIVKEEKKARLEHFLKDPEKKAEWDQASSEKQKEIENLFFHQAEKFLRLYFLCEKVKKEAAIEFSKEEIDQRAILLLNEWREQATEAALKKTRFIATLKLTEEKVEDYLWDKSQ